MCAEIKQIVADKEKKNATFEAFEEQQSQHFREELAKYRKQMFKRQEKKEKKQKERERRRKKRKHSSGYVSPSLSVCSVVSNVFLGPPLLHHLHPLPPLQTQTLPRPAIVTERRRRNVRERKKRRKDPLNCLIFSVLPKWKRIGKLWNWRNEMIEIENERIETVERGMTATGGERTTRTDIETEKRIEIGTEKIKINTKIDIETTKIEIGTEIRISTEKIKRETTETKVERNIENEVKISETKKIGIKNTDEKRMTRRTKTETETEKGKEEIKKRVKRKNTIPKKRQWKVMVIKNGK